MLPWSRFDSDWFPWSSNGKSKIQPVTKCQCPVTGPGTPLHLLNWPVHHQILIFRSLPLLTLICVNYCWKKMKSNLLINVNSCEPCCYIPLICPFQLPKVHMAKNRRRYSYTLKQNCGDNCLHFPHWFCKPCFQPPDGTKKRGGSDIRLEKRRVQDRLLRRRKIWGFYKIGWRVQHAISGQPLQSPNPLQSFISPSI